MKTLSGKVVLITGAASGIGAETARVLATRGARLMLVDVRGAELAEVVDEFEPDRVAHVAADVRDLDAMTRAVAVAADRFGGLDYVVANAGIVSYGSLLAVDPVVFRQVIDVNLTGVFHTVRAALPALIESRGYILVVSSLAAFTNSPGMAAYHASKAGVESLTETLRLEVAHHGVGVGCAHPHWTRTPLMDDAFADLPVFREYLGTLPRPLAHSTPVRACADAFADTLARRGRWVNVPRWIGLFRWLHPLLGTTLVQRDALAHVPRMLPRLDAEVATLGRSTNARTAGAERPDSTQE
ncbi:SDR family oxidoreductase [Nocardia brasiliensis]|uniref:Short chain dehydrogenase n=1 Tax=Nocardia brasiliensis (strain ATCC 700358 / HUJEG-1) TaxID=1133849 RepID=K0F6I6_NOCB7|nr:SDR family oxidoreductase [Nocardia brasiliensis]AFU05297.1 short chain dehydrogenase [Nocardia brasiliensis ATCC 700358]OCF87987.1 short-chain dehydrogenase [Nocardia brasiliensis]